MSIFFLVKLPRVLARNINDKILDGIHFDVVKMGKL